MTKGLLYTIIGFIQWIKSKGLKYRTGLKIFNLGVKLRWVWLMDVGDRIKRSGAESTA